MVGETVGSYRVTQALGRHRWGDRFAAEPAAGGAAVVLLLVDADACGDPARVERCLADVRAAAALGQAAIAAVPEAGVHADGRAYVVTAQLGGETLAARVRGAGRMSATQLAVVGRQLATALAAAHGKGLAHRELSPEDVEIVAAPELPNGERVVVSGFGLGQLGGHRAPAYVAPEQWNDAGAPDARSDIYALGCIAFEMACGQPPFGSGAEAELRARHLSAPAPLARSMTPDVPGALEHLLGKLLEKRPEDRPQSAGDLVRTFEVLGGGALASGPLAPTGINEALPPPAAVRAPAPSGFGPAARGQGSSVQPPRSYAVASGTVAPASAAPVAGVLYGSEEAAPARPAEAPRYSEPPRKKGMAAWMIVGIVLLVIGIVVAVVAMQR